jgi:hypothetical protein
VRETLFENPTCFRIERLFGLGVGADRGGSGPHEIR